MNELTEGKERKNIKPGPSPDEVRPPPPKAQPPASQGEPLIEVKRVKPWPTPSVKATEMNKSKMKEFEEICKPLVKWIRENGDPYTRATIEYNHVSLAQDVFGCPIPEAEGEGNG